MVIQAITILLRAHSASEQLKSPDTCVAPVASVKNGLTHQKICKSSKTNTALLKQPHRSECFSGQMMLLRQSLAIHNMYYQTQGIAVLPRGGLYVPTTSRSLSIVVHQRLRISGLAACSLLISVELMGCLDPDRSAVSTISR